MEAVVARLEALGRVKQRQISGLGLGDLSNADPDALGVITLTLAEKATIAPGPDRAGDNIRSRLRDALSASQRFSVGSRPGPFNHFYAAHGEV